jgi:uncharacterized protein YqeY
MRNLSGFTQAKRRGQGRITPLQTRGDVAEAVLVTWLQALYVAGWWTTNVRDTLMDMRDRVSSALKDAMRSKEADRLSTLRLINAAIKDKDIALRGSTSEEGGVTDDDILGIMGRMVKQRQESARAYEEGGRLELAEKELLEIKVIEEFLPKQLSADEAEAAVAAAIAEVGAESIRDMGKVMASLKTKYTGRMDFGKAGPMVKDRLG